MITTELTKEPHVVRSVLFKEKEPAAFTARPSSKARSMYLRVIERRISSYVPVDKFVLGTNATDDIIAEAHTEIGRFTQQKDILPLQHDDVLWMKTLRYQQVYDAHVLKGTFVQGLPFKTRHSMSSFGSSNKHATLHILNQEATSLTELQKAAWGVHTSKTYRCPLRSNGS